MDPISENLTQVNAGAFEARRRRAWGVLTLSVATAAAFAAFLNGAFVGSARSAGTAPDATELAWTQGFADTLRGAVSVPGDYRSIQQAIDGVGDGAMILLAPGTYRERIVLQDKNVRLWGLGGADTTRIIGDGSDGPIAMVRGGSVHFDGITFQGGRGDAGRGASVIDGAASFAACRFIGNCGGARAVDAAVRFERCGFMDNRADIEGGALQSERSDVRLDGCALQDNAAGTFGGGVSARAGQVDLRDTTIRRNRLVSGAWGGGLYAEGAEVRMERGDFTMNEASASGGGAYVLGGHCTMSSVRFEDNLAPAAWSVHGEQAQVRLQGGALQGTPAINFAGTVTAEGATFTDDADCDRDGMPDRVAIARGWAKDCDGNGRPDACDTDCNRNGIPDACEIARGLAEDLDGDGQIDACQAREAEELAMQMAQAFAADTPAP